MRKLKQHAGLLRLLYIKDTHLCQEIISYFNSCWNVTCPTKHNCRALKWKRKWGVKNTKIAWRHRGYGAEANATISAQSRRSTRHRNIFLLCRGELEAIRKKEPNSMQCYLQVWSNRHDKSTVSRRLPRPAAISKAVLKQWFVEGSLRWINASRSPRETQLLYRH